MAEWMRCDFAWVVQMVRRTHSQVLKTGCACLRPGIVDPNQKPRSCRWPRLIFLRLRVAQPKSRGRVVALKPHQATGSCECVPLGHLVAVLNHSLTNCRILFS